MGAPLIRLKAMAKPRVAMEDDVRHQRRHNDYALPKHHPAMYHDGAKACRLETWTLWNQDDHSLPKYYHAWLAGVSFSSMTAKSVEPSWFQKKTEFSFDGAGSRNALRRFTRLC